MAYFRFIVLSNDPGEIEVENGVFLNSDFEKTSMRVKKAPLLPQEPGLGQNYPNPFNPSTQIRFQIPTARDVELRVYNLLGQTVRTLISGPMKAGIHTVAWDGSDARGRPVASGVYFYSIKAGDFAKVRKMTMLK